MYRAIPEVNRICAMADRSRSYRLHQQALARIKNRPATFKNSDAIGGGSIPSYAGSTANDDSKSTYSRSTSLLNKAQKEKQIQIYNENQKILKAIEYQTPTICRADFYEHEMDHQRQVSRMTGKPELYGFPVSKDSNKANLNKKNKSKKTKNFDPEIVRPMPKKFDIEAFENEEAKSNSSNKKSQKGNDGKLEDVLSNNANGLCNASKNSSNKNKQNQKKKPQKTTKDENKSGGGLDDILANGINGLNTTPRTEEKDEETTEQKDEQNDEQKDDDKNDEQKDEENEEQKDEEKNEQKDDDKNEQKDDDKNEQKDDDKNENDDGDLDKIVGNGISSLTGDAEK